MNYYDNILNSDDNVSNSSSKLDLQRELMPLMDDPIFIGMKKPTGTAVAINRLNQSFGLTDLQLKTRGGNFANNLSQNVMLNVINIHGKRKKNNRRDRNNMDDIKEYAFLNQNFVRINISNK